MDKRMKHLFVGDENRQKEKRVRKGSKNKRNEYYKSEQNMHWENVKDLEKSGFGERGRREVEAKEC